MPSKASKFFSNVGKGFNKTVATPSKSFFTSSNNANHQPEPTFQEQSITPEPTYQPDQTPLTSITDNSTESILIPSSGNATIGTMQPSNPEEYNQYILFGAVGLILLLLLK